MKSIMTIILVMMVSITFPLNVSGESESTDFNDVIITKSSSDQERDVPWSQYQGDNRKTGRSSYDISNNSCEILWKQSIGDRNQGSIAIGINNILYFGLNNGSIIAMDPNGNLIWSYKAEGRFKGSPTILSNGNIVIGCYDYNLYCFNPNGSLKWIFNTNNEIISTIIETPKKEILFGSFDSYLYCLYLNGSLKWKYYANGGSGVFTFATDDNGTIYLGSSMDYQRLTALYPNGSFKWDYSIGVQHDVGGPTIDEDGIIYFTSSYGRLYSVYPNGSLNWIFNTTYTHYTSLSCALNIDGRIIFGDHSGFVYSLNKDGSLYWKYKLETAIYSTPTIDVKGNIIIEEEDNYLHIFSANGTHKLKVNTGSSSLRSSPAISSDGRIYTINENFIVCLGNKKPFPPTNISREVGFRYINISWSEPNEMVKSPIFEYSVYRNDTNGGWIKIYTSSQDQRFFNDTNVSNGVEYKYYLTAINLGGESTPSIITRATPTGKPLAPINLKGHSEVDSINLSWTPPIDNGGLSIIKYIVYRIDDQSETTEPKKMNAYSDYYLDNKVFPDVNYTYWVTAINIEGEGDPSESITIRKMNPTDAPNNIQVTNGDGFVRLNWDQPDILGDANEIFHYRIYRNGTFLSNITSNEYNDTGLTNGIEYYYSVSAFTDIGEGLMSSTIKGEPFSYPSQPQNLQYLLENQTVTITWDPPINDGGSSIISYVVIVYEDGEKGDQYEVFTNEYSRTDLPYGIEFEFIIKAKTRFGEGSPSEPVRIYLDIVGAPGSPESFSVELITEGVHLTWSEPSDIGDGILLGYHVYRIIENTTDPWILLTTVNENEYIDKNVEKQVTYIYRISAYNSIGEGPKTDEKKVYISHDIDKNGDGPNHEILSIVVFIGLIAILLSIIIIFIIIRRKRKSEDRTRKTENEINESNEGIEDPISQDESLTILEGDQIIHDERDISLPNPDETFQINPSRIEPPEDQENSSDTLLDDIFQDEKYIQNVSEDETMDEIQFSQSIDDNETIDEPHNDHNKL